MPVNIAETLTGHSAGNIHEQYVHKELISMKTLQEGLEKLRYEEVIQALTNGQREWRRRWDDIQRAMYISHSSKPMRMYGLEPITIPRIGHMANYFRALGDLA